MKSTDPTTIWPIWRFRSCFVYGLLLWVNLFSGESSASEAAPLFENQELLEVILNAPLTSAFRERTRDERRYHPASISYRDSSGSEIIVKTQVRTRGNFRRARSTCSFPPLQLKFSRKNSTHASFGSLFQGQRKLKLVTHCRAAKRYEIQLLNEYLAYRIFNLMTAASFKVRLLHLSYKDMDGKRSDLTRYGFFIEPKQALAKRLNATLVKRHVVKPAELDVTQASLVEVFQYLIGNTDWSMLRGPAGEKCCHNMVALQQQNGLLLPLPYDFDFAGVVNAPYAEPNEQLGITSVRQRLFRGRCWGEKALRLSLDAFRQEQASIFGLYERTPGLDERNRRTATKYLMGFYRILANPKRIRREFGKTCRA